MKNINHTYTVNGETFDSRAKAEEKIRKIIKKGQGLTLYKDNKESCLYWIGNDGNIFFRKIEDFQK